MTRGAAIAPDGGPHFLRRTNLRIPDVNGLFIWESNSMVLVSPRPILTSAQLLRRLAGAFFCAAI
jgi:hypothetical protein